MPPKTNSLSARYWQYPLLLVLIGLLGLTIWTAFNPVKVKDWFRLLNYKAPAQISELAGQDGFTPYSRELFYVNSPKVEPKSAFAKDCPNNLDNSYVIGCYHSGDNGIYLLDVSDPALKDVLPVTAAYEMLHAGYARLSATQKNALDQQMYSFYLIDVNSPVIQGQMAAYKASEPGAEMDELHSVLGTEVSNLTPQLEAYYKRYFNNRSLIVTMYNNYQDAFTSRQQQIASLTSQLNQLKYDIDGDNAEISTLSSTISTRLAQLQSEASSGEPGLYNSQVPAYNQLVDQYNALLADRSTLSGKYNSLVVQINSLVLEEQQLEQMLNAGSSKSINKI